MPDIRYNEALTLTAPAGMDAIIVSVDIEPATASCVIYGFTKDGKTLQPVRVLGSAARLELPYGDPKVYVRYEAGLRTLRISTLGWRDAAGVHDSAGQTRH